MARKSPFVIHKAIIGIDFPLTVNPHIYKSLNSCRGVISEPDLLSSSEAEILEGLSDQGVTQVRRISVKKDSSLFPTKNLILTFNSPKLPSNIKAGYLNCKVRSYIPNPLRCFKCQRFGHSQTSCRGQLTCSRCASVGHASTDCSLEPKCINCLQPHPSDSKLCPKWKIEKHIQEIKTTQNISYPEARKLIVPQLPQTYAQATRSSTLNNSTQTDENITKINCPPLKLLAPLSSKQRTNIPTSINTSSSAQTQLLPTISSKKSTISNPQPPTPMSKTKGKIKEQPSQLHRPRKDNKTIDLLSIKPTPNLKKNPAKNTTLKTAREQDSPNDSTPVSKRSRRRKTSKTSDAMDTDANPSDSDCVIDTEGPSVSGGVCIFTSLDFPSSALPLHTSLQAVAVRIHSTSLITVCCLYLPPNTAIHQHDLNNLINQLPAPFVILGDFNGHSTLWDSAKTNPRGRQIEQVLSDHCLCLLNHEEPTYFHEPTRSFHTIDLAICSPSLLPHLNLSVENNLYNSDHFPVILSHDSDPAGKTFPPTYSYRRADWALSTQLAVITDAMVKAESIDTTVQEVTNVLIAAADLSIPKSSSHSFKHYKPWWNADCQTAYKNQRKLWGIFRRYPTTENLLAFKKAKANARRVRRRSQRQSWIRYVSSLTSSTSSKQLWKKSGFRKGRSPLDNLVFLESQIRDAFVRRNHLVSLFFDIEKAYDRTWRYGILRNMYDFGLRGNIPIFIFNFLAVRYFNVRIGHSSSHKFIRDQGFPQGSVLSVTLFNIHTSNILHQLPPSVRGMLYVDDLQVSCQGSDMRLIERQLQTTVNRLVQWCDQNGHTISPSKSSCVHFCRKRSLHPDPSIHIGHIQIPVVSAVRFLGVI
ncbi:putative RNA-directed DNA polymerase from transposon X-element [Trichonephila clavipes]|nr:putative RNA-directed DNA polymerase from transposon X-element [Trichonephila clavipes]